MSLVKKIDKKFPISKSGNNRVIKWMDQFDKGYLMEHALFPY